MFLGRLDELNQCLQNIEVYKGSQKLSLDEALEEFSWHIGQANLQDGIIYVIGNGGSSGIASHFSNDLLKALDIPSSTLTDSNTLTCFGNDFGYEHVFSGPLERLLKSRDILVAISSSGCSENILRASEVAKSKGAGLITLSGFSAKNPLRELGELNFWVNKEDYGLVEMAHFFILHTLVDKYKICQKKFTHSLSF